jgi:hypothetical protein
MSKTDFLTFLVDETLKLQKTGQANLSSLELKLKDYKLSFLKGEFIPQTKVMRFMTSFGALDFPINWSIFSGECSSNLMIHESNDQDHLLKILQTTWSSEMKRLLISHDDGFCYFIALRQGDECYLHDLLNRQETLSAA